MADPIDEWKVERWMANVHQLAQQMTRRLMGTIAEASGNPSTRIGMDNLAPMVGERGRGSRFSPTPNIGSNETRRWINPDYWSFGKLVDNWDVLETLHMLSNEYARAGAMDKARFGDEKVIGTFSGTLAAFTDIVGGALGTVDEGELSTVAVPFDTTNRLIVDGGTGLTTAKVNEVNVRFLEAEYDPGAHGPLTMVYAPRALTILLSEVSSTSADFVSIKALMSGRPVQGFMGIDRWIPSNLLPKVGDVRRMVCYAQEAVVRGSWQMDFARATERTDLRHRPQIYMETVENAARRDDKLVYAIDIDETAVPA